VLVLHDEIDLPFGRIQVRTGGGVAGHNGLKSVRDGLGSTDFTRVRVGVGRPNTSDPEVVSSYVLGRFREPREDVEQLIEDAADAAEELIRAT
jgi:PTH1 family peptidyl-tRNA hydrolase